MATHKLALIIKNPSNDSQFLLLKQSPPPKFDHDEYDSFIDSDLWDLPSTKLSPLEGESNPRIVVEGEESCSERLELCKFDLNLALNQVLEQVGFGTPSGVQWKLWKCVEEPEFGPGLPVQTVYVVGILGPENGDLQGLCKWMSLQSCLSCLLEVKPSSDRVGPLVVIGLVNDSLQSAKWKIPPTLNFQEYPLGVKLVPMGSRTAKPFHTTNLVVFSPESVSDGLTDSSFVSHGDALIVDPGCRLECHKELEEIIAALPRKLVVFVTHHHHDHVDEFKLKQTDFASAYIHRYLLIYQKEKSKKYQETTEPYKREKKLNLMHSALYHSLNGQHKSKHRIDPTETRPPENTAQTGSMGRLLRLIYGEGNMFHFTQDSNMLIPHSPIQRRGYAYDEKEIRYLWSYLPIREQCFISNYLLVSIFYMNNVFVVKLSNKYASNNAIKHINAYVYAHIYFYYSFFFGGKIYSISCTRNRVVRLKLQNLLLDTAYQHHLATNLEWTSLDLTPPEPGLVEPMATPISNNIEAHIELSVLRIKSKDKLVHLTYGVSLSVVQKSNPDATLLAHENTMGRIRKDHWSLGHTPVSGGEEICIGGQRLRVIYAPGHTDGHMALLHVNTHSLIVGDHCVGQGSAVLDITSGANMHEYFQTTYQFMEISPHVLIPMHGRLNLWPKHMLCAYLKNRRSRESTILKSIENGAKTLFDIVSYTYADVDRSLWIPAASNVRLHVDHLAKQDKLPKNISMSSWVSFWKKMGFFINLHVGIPLNKMALQNEKINIYLK
ncbi:hypothetical protein HYC85_021462 [Camellia sinensis]|uniref:LACTB2 winged helix domain-containing protein n=1 Tax=Camellia sinensis TaxID=4442 RepID=A0A7J7GJA2_CAMSI|nr:hypothetical protein HYC85_021462 [Camellia sinensis]